LPRPAVAAAAHCAVQAIEACWAAGNSPIAD
jgi:hypothetical protein